MSNYKKDDKIKYRDVRLCKSTVELAANAVAAIGIVLLAISRGILIGAEILRNRIAEVMNLMVTEYGEEVNMDHLCSLDDNITEQVRLINLTWNIVTMIAIVVIVFGIAVTIICKIKDKQKFPDVRCTLPDREIHVACGKTDSTPESDASEEPADDDDDSEETDDDTPEDEGEDSGEGEDTTK